MSSTLEYKYVQSSQKLMEYIARMRYDIQEYANREKVNQFFLDKQNAKLEEINNIKHEFDNIMQSMLLSYTDAYDTGKQAGYKEAEKAYNKKLNSYDPLRPAEIESYREAHKSLVMQKWPELF